VATRDQLLPRERRVDAAGGVQIDAHLRRDRAVARQAIPAFRRPEWMPPRMRLRNRSNASRSASARRFLRRFKDPLVLRPIVDHPTSTVPLMGTVANATTAAVPVRLGRMGGISRDLSRLPS